MNRLQSRRIVRLIAAWLGSHLQHGVTAAFRWWLKRTKKSWSRELQDPENRPAIYLMPVQLLVLYVVLEHAFQAGLMIGFSYMGWYVWAASSAVIIKWPFGPLVPAVVFVGVIAVGAIRPLVFDAKDAAMQGQLVSAAVVVAVALILSQYFGRLQRGDMS